MSESKTLRNTYKWAGIDPLLTLIALTTIFLAACGGSGNAPISVTIGGSVSGLAGLGLVLQDDGGNNLQVNPGSNGFTFSSAVVSGASYDITVSAQPSNPSQTCTVMNATGTATANVTDVQVACTTNTYTIGGTISGFTGAGLLLQNNRGNNLPVSAGATSFVFTTAIISDGSYSVAVYSQPSNPSQTCVVTNASGPVTNTDITNIQVTCTSTFVYVSNERDNTISAYSVATNGNLTALAASPFGAGSSPEGLAVDPSGKFLYVANLLANNVSGFAIASDGSLSPIPGSPFPAASGAVSVAIDPTGRFLYVPSCGSDCSGSGSGGIAAFVVSPENGALTAITGSPFAAGTFPYEMEFFSPPSGGPFAYVANRGSNTISGYLLQPTGTLSPVSGSPFAAGTAPLALAVDPDLSFPRLFAVNTESDNLSINSIQADGSLFLVSGSPIATGTFTSSVTEDANEHLYVSGGSGIFAFTASTALPSLIAGSPFAAGRGPSQVRIDPSGQFLYVVNAASNTVSGYTISATSGVLNALPGSPFPTGNFPHYISFATR